MPRRCIWVPRPRPSAVMPGRLISSGYFQRASYSRKPVGTIIASRRNSQVLGVTVGKGVVIQSSQKRCLETKSPDRVGKHDQDKGRSDEPAAVRNARLDR